MLALSGALINKPVLSLRTNGVVATTVSAIINPNNLKIEGFVCRDRFSKQNLVLLYQDIRDNIPQGFVIDDHDVLSPPEDLLRLKDILELNFELKGKPVVTIDKARLGKVTDYAAEAETMFIQKLYVSQSILKNLSGGSLSVDRSQIVEITNRKITVQNLLRPLKSSEAAVAPALPAV